MRKFELCQVQIEEQDVPIEDEEDVDECLERDPE